MGETFGVTVSVYNDAAPSAPNGFVYYYRVRCRDQWSPAYLSGASNELALFVSDKVANIDATQPGNYTIDVSWDQLADPPTIGAAAVAGYEIYRSTWPANRFAPVGSTVGAASVNFTDTGVTHGIPVWYAVAARYDNGWLSPMSIGPSIMPSGPPSKPVLTLTATETGAMLTWLASVSNISSVTHYSVFRSTQGGSDGGVPELVNRTVLNYRDTALANGTLYYYRVAGYDSNTTSAYSDEAAVLPLATPRSLSAYPADDVIRLGWAVLTATAGIDSFEIYRYSTLEGEILAGTSPGGMATLFIDNNVDNGVPYTYRVRGVASTGSGPVYGMFSNVLGVSSAAPPSAPNNPSAVASTASIQVCWTAPSQGGTNGVAGYRVYRSTFAGGQAAPPLGTVTIPTVCYNDMAVTANTTYYYRISAYDTAAPAIEGPLSNEVYGKPYYNPSPPFGLTTVPGNNYLLITWKSPVITTYEVTRYNVYRGVTPGGEGPIPVNSTPVYATYYVDATAFNGTLYFYRIRATDVAGHTSVNSEEAYGRPYGAPGAPVNLSALPGNTVVMLTWGAAAAGTYGIAAYNIYRGSAPGTATTFVTSVSPTTLGLIDTASISATDYYYTVRTVDGQGHLSAPAPEIYVLPSDAIVNPPFDVGMTAGNGYIDLTWSFTVNGNTPGGPIDEYVILRSSPTCAMCTSVYVTATVMTHTDMTVMNGISYTYVVRSVRNAGPNIESLDYPGYNVVSAPAAPYVPAGAPGNFVVNAGMGAVEMRWDASTPGTFPVAAYRVYRGSPGCPCMTLVGTLDETIRVFADYGVANGTAYQYRVVAVDDNGNEGAAAISGTVIPNMRQTETYLSVNVFAPLRGERLDITYTLEKKSDVRVRIFTLAGLQVWETEMKDVPAGPSLGSYVIAAPDGLPGWDGRAPDKQFVSSGVYLIRIEAAGRKKTLKVIVIK